MHMSDALLLQPHVSAPVRLFLFLKDALLASQRTVLLIGRCLLNSTCRCTIEAANLENAGPSAPGIVNDMYKSWEIWHVHCRVLLK